MFYRLTGNIDEWLPRPCTYLPSCGLSRPRPTHNAAGLFSACVTPRADGFLRCSEDIATRTGTRVRVACVHALNVYVCENLVDSLSSCRESPGSVQPLGRARRSASPLCPLGSDLHRAPCVLRPKRRNQLPGIFCSASSFLSIFSEPSLSYRVVVSLRAAGMTNFILVTVIVIPCTSSACRNP